MEPTPAAAPSLTPDDEANRTFQGILKAVVDGLDTSYYVEPPAKICLLSSDKNKALRVRCNSLCGTTLLERTVSFIPVMTLRRHRVYSLTHCRIIRAIPG